MIEELELIIGETFNCSCVFYIAGCTENSELRKTFCTIFGGYFDITPHNLDSVSFFAVTFFAVLFFM